MPPTFSFIETEDQLSQALHFWKNFTFSEKCIRLQDAIDTIDTDTPMVEAKHVWAPKWVVSLIVLLAYFLSDPKPSSSNLPTRRQRSFTLLSSGVSTLTWRQATSCQKEKPHLRNSPKVACESPSPADLRLTLIILYYGALLATFDSQHTPGPLCELSYGVFTDERNTSGKTPPANSH